MELLQFWGKAETQPPHDAHPALCHMLDVSAVAAALLNHSQQLPNSKRQCLHQEIGHANRNWLLFIIALHDLGKLTPGFQRRMPALCQKFNKTHFPLTAAITEEQHALATMNILTKILEYQAGYPFASARLLAKAVAVHHGEFFLPIDPPKPTGDADWVNAQRATAERLRAIFGLQWQDFPFPIELSPEFIVTLAGLTSLADWLASNKNIFKYTQHQGEDLREYWTTRQAIAQQWLQTLHLQIPLNATRPQTFTQLFGCAPNPYQRQSLPLLNDYSRPSLFIIETPSGSGKTETALAIADHALRQQLADGIYYALPTQATAEQMFTRFKTFLQQNTALTAAVPHLLHPYACLQPVALDPLHITAVYDETDPASPRTGSVDAAEWFMGAKRGLLSPFAVGSLDQLLTAVLKVRHFFVRLYGLAGKVVIIDEFHAYDAYTAMLLETLLSWLARLQCTVIILSAALPPQQRTALLKAYAPTLLLDSASSHTTYPCVLTVAQEATTAQTFNMAAVTQSTLVVQLHTVMMDATRWDTVVDILQNALAAGGCAACVLNTVAEAQALFKHLQAQPAFNDALCVLFHAQFPLVTQLAIEQQLIRQFGNAAAADRPFKAIVVGTQGLEQSLDVDFDVMISDLAPIDLLLQRAGRLHRHQCTSRPTTLATPILHCLQPSLAVAAPDFGRTQTVYHPYLLALTGVALQGRANSGGRLSLSLPDDVEPLIMQVYEAEPATYPPQFADYLTRHHLFAQSADNPQAFLGTAQMIKAPRGKSKSLFRDISVEFTADNFLLDAQPVSDETATCAQARLLRPSITLVLLQQLDGAVTLPSTPPLVVDLAEVPTPAQVRQLLTYSLTLSDPDWVTFFQQQSIPLGWQTAVGLSNCRVVVLDDGHFHCEVGRLRLDSELGVALSTDI